MVIDYLWHIYQSTLIKYYQTVFSSEKLKNMIFITLVFCIWTCSCMLHFSILSLCKYQCSISPIKNICSYQFLDDSASSAKNPFTFQTVSETQPRKTLIKTARGMPKKPIFADILNLNPIIDMKHEWKNELEYWVLGTVFKTVQQGANKCLTNVAFIENYGIGIDMVREYHNNLKKSGDQLRKLPPPPKVCLNCHNILDVQKSPLEVCSSCNRLYCTRGLKCQHTSHGKSSEVYFAVFLRLQIIPWNTLLFWNPIGVTVS